MLGILNIDKPKGWSSFDVIRFLKRLFNEKKAGHLGTLDPLASGVLPVFLGKGTRLIPYFNETDKVYRARIHLGIRTDTFDAEGKILEEKECPPQAERVSSPSECIHGRAQLARLNHQLGLLDDPAEIATLNAQIVDVSVANRVLCEQTSLLVLETAEDYDRYGLDRNALADILVLNSSGLQLQQRTAVVLAPSAAPAPKAARKKGKTRAVDAGQPTSKHAQVDGRLANDRRRRPVRLALEDLEDYR